MLAVHFSELLGLADEIGMDRVVQLRQLINRFIGKHKRLEDAPVSWHQGYLILTLPGTSARGAAAAAQRLQQSLRKHEFALDEYHVCLQPRIVVHCRDPESKDTPRDLLTTALGVLKTDASKAPVILSARAESASSEEDQAARQCEASLALQLEKLVSQNNRDDILQTLTPAMSRLDEGLRLQLVDLLLEASLAHSRLASQ
ncbi:hypothetical protein A11A3_04950 [Alcanivorax hongdengensis A-11-3]|uniref:GGDEF domain-containing protein n=1 Tax=Alcanivorax hongdengensis A-11-3 TaxID=1177179 RepID=L0WHI3_9GAMM|nr:hypothetical protein A11A3_04950 [Alcanivorax hongdengensis A-11-3]